MSTETPATSSDPRTAAELVARIETGWRIFRDAVRHVGRARLADRIADGWSYRDMLAHVAAWMEFAPDRLRAIRSGEPDPLRWSDEEGDRFNSRAVAERRLVGPEAIIDELDTSYRRLLDLARRATDEEIERSSHDSGILSVLAWATYLHWEEHHADLGVAREATS